MSFKYDIGLEAIDFQTDRSFGKELTAIFQNVMTLRDSLAGNPQKIKKVIDYCHSYFYNAFTACVKKHTGILITHIHVYETPTFGFQTRLDLDELPGYQTAVLTDRYIGSGMGEQFAKEFPEGHTPLTADEMIDLTNRINLHTGKFSMTNLKSSPFKLHINFDPYTAFLMKETVHLNAPYFTASQIAAIMLHEIGHSLTVIEHASDAFYRIQVMKYAGVYFKANASLGEKMKFVKAKLSDAKLSNEQSSAASNAIATMEKIKLEEADGNPLAVTSAIVFLGAVYILNILFSLIVTALCSVYNIFVITHDSDYISYFSQYETALKSGDFAKTPTNGFLDERWADEYVSRQGMSADLMSGINLIHYVCGSAGVSLKVFRNSSFYWHVAKYPALIIQLLGSDADGIHDNLIIRTKQLLGNTIVAFKQQDLPEEVLNIYIADYEATLKVLDRIPIGDRIGLAADKVWSFIQFFVAPENLYAAVTTGKFGQEYEVLIRKMDHMTDSPLFYQSAKLQQLINNK